MDWYKEFLIRLRKIELDEFYIIILPDNITEKLIKYVLLLRDVKFKDGSYHEFYGDVKKVVGSFLVYFNHTVEEATKLADRYTNIITKDELLGLVENTISIHHTNQVKLGNVFLPVKTVREKEVYEEMGKAFDDFIGKLYALKERIEKFDKKETIDDYAKENLGRAVVKAGEVFKFVHEYIAMLLADSLNRIRTSLEEIHLRMCNNLRKAQQDTEEGINALLHQLYDKNKENLAVSRRERKCSKEIAEVNHGITSIKNKIANYDTEVPMARIQEEVTYWKKRLADFNEIANNLDKLNFELKYTIEQQNIYNSMRSTELPGSRAQCWINMGVNFNNRKKYLEKMILEEAKALLTFLAVRGTDRIVHTDHIGPNYIDEYNHQVYVFDYGMAVYHVTCEGDFKQVPNHPYYIDKSGRYVYSNGEKTYQAAPCTSHHKLGDDELLQKVTTDCGHSENNKNNNQCSMQIRDPNDQEILPDTRPIDIRQTLDDETVKYLWDSFGSLLPEALTDVGTARPSNPIHYLAHKLLYHKYRRTTSELQIKKKEADLYRANIFKERKEAATAAAKQWRSKQVQRRKPEESDDAQDQALNAHIAQQMFIHALNYE